MRVLGIKTGFYAYTRHKTANLITKCLYMHKSYN